VQFAMELTSDFDVFSDILWSYQTKIFQQNYTLYWTFQVRKGYQSFL
jgi:hypothetical protein